MRSSTVLNEWNDADSSSSSSSSTVFLHIIHYHYIPWILLNEYHQSYNLAFQKNTDTQVLEKLMLLSTLDGAMVISL